MKRIATTLVKPLVGSMSLQLRVEQSLLLLIGYGTIGTVIANWWL